MPKHLYFLCLNLILLSGTGMPASAQTLASVQLQSSPTNATTDPNQITLKSLLDQLESTFAVRFNYRAGLVRSAKVAKRPLEYFNKGMTEQLNQLLAPLEMLCVEIDAETFVIREKRPLKRNPSIREESPRIDGADAEGSPVPPTDELRTPDAVPDRSITGRVTDAVSGEGLPGVSILLKGTQKGTTTDAEGTFKLTVPDDESVLMFSFVGYLSQEIISGNKTQFDIVMRVDNKALEEVVVIGYGTISKSDLTGSVAKISAEGVDERPVTSVEQFLQGQVSGVQITQNTGAPGGGISFNIRGATSVSGSNQPLVVIDGYPVDSDNGSVRMSGGSQSGYLGQLPEDNALASLNPGDIESIEILKDASATAIYGSRASNGVVLITTKRGKAGADRISYTFRFDISMLPKKIDVLGTMDYLNYSNEASLNNGQDSIFRAAQIAQYSGVNTVWQDLIYQEGHTNSHQLNVSGGQDKLRYAVSVGYLSQEGIVKNSNYDRGSLRINLDREFSRKLKFGVNMNGVLSRNRAAMQSSNIADASMSVVRGALTSRPFDSPYTSEDELEIDQTQLGNPLTLINLSDDQNRMTTALGNIFADYTIVRGLTFRVNGGVNVRSTHRDFYHPRGTTLGNREGGYAYRGHISSFNYLTEYTLNFNRVIAEKHSINAVGGYTWQQWNRRVFGINALNFPNDNLLYYDLSSATSITNPTTSTTEWGLSSFIGRVNYSFDKKYIVTFTARADGSTRLASDNKWDFFPSVAFGWNMHKESFMESVSSVSELKIRASYGFSGNQAVGVGSTKAMLNSTGSVANQSIQIGYVLANLPNQNLHWETTAQTNIGADATFFKNRLTMGFDYYNKRTHDLLINLTIPPSNGFTSYSTNQGIIENQGLEFDVNAKLLTGRFGWDISGNISRNRNKVISLGDRLNSFVSPGYTAVAGQSLTIARVGSPIGSYYGYRVVGVYQNQTEVDAGPTDSYTRAPGMLKFKDISGADGHPDGAITVDDREIIGTPYPDFIFGLTNKFDWKGLSLNILFQGSIGQEIINANRYAMDAMNRVSGANIRQEAWDNRWRGEGTSNFYPRPDMADPFQSRFTDFIVEDGSYVRLRNVTLAYTFPKRKLPVFKSLKVFASGGNLITWTNYKGYDPEINSKGDNSMLSGIDNGSIPQYRTYSFGLSAGF